MTLNSLILTAEFLGFDHHMPPFATAQGNVILQGVNYASSGSGILNETGKIVVMITLPTINIHILQLLLVLFRNVTYYSIKQWSQIFPIYHGKRKV